MKKHNGYSIPTIIISVSIVALIAIGAFFVIDGNNKSTNFEEYDFTSIIKADEHNGNIGDHIKGNPDAPVVIVEYADFQCGYCALMNPRIESILEKTNGNLAVVYRNYLLSYHQNGTAAASAAEAAGLQGYWKEYTDKLFNEQAEWESASTSDRTALFTKYFEEVTNGKGDNDKFVKDMGSDNVSKKISFDMGIGKRVNISGTPAFYIDGQFISFGSKDGGEVTIGGKTIKWDHALSSEEFESLIVDIVNAKLATLEKK